MAVKETLKEQTINVVRQLIVCAVVIGVLVLVFAGQTATQNQQREDTKNGILATACELALPSDPVKGRDPAAVRLCFTQYGLQPPVVVAP